MNAADTPHPAIGQYLQNVQSHLGHLSPPERADLLKDLESHIHEALQARCGDTCTDADVRAVLSEMDSPESFAQDERAWYRRLALGQWSLILAVGTLVLTAILYSLVGSQRGAMLPVLIFLGGEIPAMVLGIVSWKDPFGKAGTFTSGALMVLILLLMT